MKYVFDRNTQTVNEIFNAFEKKQLIIDESYQRRKVWVAKDRISLIETILLGLIVPEIFLWDSSRDVATGNPVKHIVDGQQRVNAIIDFISNKYKLDKKTLEDESTKNTYGDMFFKDLPTEIKKEIWAYKLSVITIDEHCTKEEIKNIFYRLNLTDYSLNEQEKRNSLSSEFGRISTILANNAFWIKHKIFSPSDMRRMKDVEYCSNILILVREGIIDQTNQEKINKIYDDLKENYTEKSNDTRKIKYAMEIIDCLSNDKTKMFLSKKTQMYTVFSFIFDLRDNNNEINTQVINIFTAFVEAYNEFRNGKEISFEDTSLSQISESIKKYKLASSEGLNKLANRMIRFEVMKRICLSENTNIISELRQVKSKFEENK